MSARGWSPQKLISRRRSQDHPVNGTNVIVIVGSMQRQVSIGEQPRMGVRHPRRMTVVRIAAMHVSERRLSEAQKQRNDSRDSRQLSQGSLQFMFPPAGRSTRPRKE